MTEEGNNNKFEGQHDPNSGASPPLNNKQQKMWLSDLSINQPVFITMVIVAIMVIGGMLYTRMGLDLFPDVTMPVTVVQTVYPGASPDEIERSITKPVEDAVSSINGVENVRSTSMDSVSLVIIEFKMEMDGKATADEVRNRVDAIRNTLPEDATEPVIERFESSASPILAVAVADVNQQRSAEDLRSLADDMVKPRLERVAGVAAAEVVGGRVSEVKVDLKLAQMESYGVAPQQVVQAIQTENIDIPAGRIVGSEQEELLRTAGEVGSLEQLKEVPVVSRPGGIIVKLKDVADVTEGYAEVRAESRLDGQDSVVVNVRKQSGSNTVQVADAVKAEMKAIEQEYPDLRFAVAYDQSTFTKESVQDIQLSLVLGALLAGLVVLFFFRDLRNTLVTIAGLPVILLGTMGVMHMLGFSMNMLTMMALSLSIGMLIDDAIVVRENIFRHMEEGEEPKVAARRGTAEIALAVVAVTSTIVAVFLPVAFTEGIAGKFLRDFGLTVAIAVMISLFEAFTLAPMLSAYFFKRIDPQTRAKTGRDWLGRFFNSLNSRYAVVLDWSLSHRVMVVVAAVVIFAGSLGIITLLPFSFMPEPDQGEFGISIELDPGARLVDTDEAARKVENFLMAQPEVAHVFGTIGSNDGSVQNAVVSVKLQESGHTDEFLLRVRPELQRILGDTRFTIDKQTMAVLFGGGAAIGAAAGRPIQYSVKGQDMELLDQVSAELVSKLREVPGITDVTRSLKPGNPERSIVVDRARATDLGVSTAQVGATVRAMVTGERAGTLRSGDDEVDIMVRLAEADRDSPTDIMRLPLLTSQGSQVQLSSLASLVQSSEPTKIERENREHLVIVGAGSLGRDQGLVLADARAIVAEMELPPGVTVEVSGMNEYMEDMLFALGLALGIAVLFVYMILASQFGSFVHPLTIMLALPFSVVGALLGLLIGGFNFDMLAMIGIILLMGLVTKNSILLVEFTNQLKRRGLSTREAIMQAGPIRLRPILMTTLAMIFGMIPVAAGLGSGAELRQAMGVSVIGGLITSTLLTLVIVPVAYSILEDLSQRLLRRGGKREATPAR